MLKKATLTPFNQYIKNELLDVVYNSMQNAAAMKDVPFMIAEITGGLCRLAGMP